MATLHESDEFNGPAALKSRHQDDAFRYCTFTDIHIEGPGLDGLAIGCTFTNSSWYWSLFNGATFIDVAFNGCVFRGCSFAGCTFLRCRFTACKFIQDNLGGECQFPDSTWYDCRQTDCVGLPKHLVHPEKPRVTR